MNYYNKTPIPQPFEECFENPDINEENIKIGNSDIYEKTLINQEAQANSQNKLPLILAALIAFDIL